jgi:hypothetical protein
LCFCGNRHAAGSAITDAGLAHLRPLRELKGIELSDTQVTDAGLLHLYGLLKLQRLEVTNTRATYEAKFKLKLALPSLSITAL